MDAEAILSRESEKTWSAVRELIRDDASVLDVLFYPNLFHNLKAAIKESVTGKSHGKVYFDDCSIDPKEMLRIIQDRDYLSLPENMRAAAQEAHETFLHTGDGQLCDIIVDRACLEAIYKAGQEAEASIIRDYAESTVAVADIKIAVRSQKTAKTLEFMKRALAPAAALIRTVWQRRRCPAWTPSASTWREPPMRRARRRLRNPRPRLSGGATTR